MREGLLFWTIISKNMLFFAGNDKICKDNSSSICEPYKILNVYLGEKETWSKILGNQPLSQTSLNKKMVVVRIAQWFLFLYFPPGSMVLSWSFPNCFERRVTLLIHLETFWTCINQLKSVISASLKIAPIKFSWKFYPEYYKFLDFLVSCKCILNYTNTKYTQNILTRTFTKFVLWLQSPRKKKVSEISEDQILKPWNFAAK